MIGANQRSVGRNASDPVQWCGWVCGIRALIASYVIYDERKGGIEAIMRDQSVVQYLGPWYA